MEMIQVQALNAGSANGANAAGTTSIQQENGGKGGLFAQALIRVLGAEESTDADANANSDIAAALAAGIVPAGVLLAILPQTNAAQVEETAQQLLNALQAADPETLQELLAHPSLQQWVNEAEQALQMSSGVNQLDGAMMPEQSATSAQTPLIAIYELAASMKNLLDSNVAAEASSSNDNGAQTAMPVTSELQAKLIQLLEKLQSHAEDPTVQKLVSDLQRVSNELVRAFPELFAKAGSTTGAEQTESTGEKVEAALAKMNNLFAPANASTAKQASSDQQGTDSNAAKQQFLQRLSYMRPLVHIVAAQGDGNVNSAGTQSLPANVFGFETASADAAVKATDASDSPMPQSLQFADLLRGTAGTEMKAPLPTINAGQFAQDMTKFMVKNLSITQLNGLTEAKISLAPEHLGQLDVKISVQNGQIVAHFVAETAGARDMLENQLPQLRAALQQQGLQVERLVVSHNQTLGSGMFQDNRGGQFSGQSDQGGKRQNQSFSGDSSSDFLVEIEQAAQGNGLGAYGSTFHASA